MNHCRDCKHWSPTKVDTGSSSPVAWAETPVVSVVTLVDLRHRCVMLSEVAGGDYPNREPSPFRASGNGYDAEVDAEDVYTGALFGCTLWEAR